MRAAQDHLARRKGVTVSELVVAVSLMAVITAGMAPLLHAVRGSWTTKAGDCESLAHARAFLHHFRQQVSQAAGVTHVSDHLATDGYFQFIAHDGNEVRYETGVEDDIQFGPVGALADVAGPADTLRFTCYDANDLDTPITDGNSIDLVRVDVVFRNPASPGRDHALSTSVYIRARAGQEAEGGLQPGVAMKNKVEWNGSGALIDSYRSSLGPYNPSQHGTGALVTVNATGSNKIVLSSGSVLYGDAYIGPGGDTDSGIKTWGGSQITGLRGTLDEPVSIPNLSAPTGAPFNGPQEGTLDLSGSTSLTIDSDRYFNRISLRGNSTLLISGDVTILVNKRFEAGGNAELQILTGSSLRLYVGHDVSVLGNARLNAVTKDPTRLQLYMIGNNRSFEMADASRAYAVLQNPKGQVGISDDAQFFGKMRAKRLDGGGMVHVDLDCAFE